MNYWQSIVMVQMSTLVQIEALFEYWSLEEHLGRPLQLSVCLLYTDELQLSNLIQKIDGGRLLRTMCVFRCYGEKLSPPVMSCQCRQHSYIIVNKI